VVSGTFVRHVVQVAAPLAAAALMRKPWGAWAAFPVFVFWLIIMGLIWAFLLGLSNFASGNYTPVEQGLTGVICIASLFGAVTVLRARPAVGVVKAFALVLGFAALQFLVMWVSFTPPFASR
jgi:hypothetical protein